MQLDGFTVAHPLRVPQARLDSLKVLDELHVLDSQPGRRDLLLEEHAVHNVSVDEIDVIEVLSLLLLAVDLVDKMLNVAAHALYLEPVLVIDLLISDIIALLFDGVYDVVEVFLVQFLVARANGLQQIRAQRRLALLSLGPLEVLTDVVEDGVSVHSGWIHFLEPVLRLS